jgi:hypothetical protein
MATRSTSSSLSSRPNGMPALMAINNFSQKEDERE